MQPTCRVSLSRRIGQSGSPPRASRLPAGLASHYGLGALCDSLAEADWAVEDIVFAAEDEAVFHATACHTRSRSSGHAKATSHGSGDGPLHSEVTPGACHQRHKRMQATDRTTHELSQQNP
eukprot:2887856-Amphidinium_carterae.1